MSAPAGRRRASVLGARTLLGKEILAALGKKGFTVASVIDGPDEDRDPDLPVLDLTADALPGSATDQLDLRECDFLFLSDRPRTEGGKRWLEEQLSPASPSQSHTPLSGCRIIDADGALPHGWKAPVRIPAIDTPDRADSGSCCFVAPHGATMVISHILLRLGARFRLQRALAHVFTSASELGAAAIDELQKQTVQLLSFQKLARSHFGAQSAFNLLPRGGPNKGEFAQLSARVLKELKSYLGDRSPIPSLRLVQVPLFHSLALSLYLEAEGPVTPAAVQEALSGGLLKVTPRSSPPPAPQQIQGSSTIVLDPVVADEQHENAFWIWASADNLRLAAENAVEIAQKS